ncbi:RNA-guided endonuclease InsQ/TnpB family protein [Oceaniradius stylonematis]|uniref:RNA-guided endonuclease InsQ/TnpB family protein n=1 Tax=Oceaniradius stylonematis TaxID=2184161 RepID=UPI00273E016C|nr:transposase [Oceaniradius stylonematis]
MIYRGLRYRLDPTADQARQFARFAGVVRLVFNLALEQRRDHWRTFRQVEGRPISFAAQCRELTLLRREYDFIREVTNTCQQQALRDLDAAFAAFFAGRARHPNPRRRGINDSFRFHGREIGVERLNRNWGRVRLPKIGWVRFRWTRAIEGKIKNVTISRDALGWHVSFDCAIEEAAMSLPRPEAVGIDRGVTRTLALSDGTFADMPMERLRLLDRRARKQARTLARCKRGSNRRLKARERLAATKAKAARIRKYFNHVQSRQIADAYGTVVVEDLATANMTRSARGTAEQPGRNVRAKAGLNRAILEQGWRQFATFLSYKLEANGGTLVSIPPAYTSQTCSACGSISKHHRKSQAVFSCADCCHAANADTNAAINILRAGTRPAVRESVAAPLTRESRCAA